MIKKLPSTLAKTPIVIAFLLVIATGCHTPEDLKEIGPQKPLIEESGQPVIHVQEKATVIDKKNSAKSRIERNANTVEKFGAGAVLIKTPFKPSVKIPKESCRGC